MRGRWVGLSIPRRIVGDLMHFSVGVPWVTVQRRMTLRGLAAAREAHRGRPPWPAVFVKAYALVAEEFPQLRTAYVRLPWPHLYEYQSSAANVAVERSFDGEPGLVFVHIAEPHVHPIVDIGQKIMEGKHPAFAETGMFQRMVRIARLPLLLRRAVWWLALNHAPHRANHFGTFGLSTISSTDTGILQPLSPLTSVVTYDRIGADGGVMLRVVFDHRVLDAMTVARALDRLEQVLNGPILDELRGGRRGSSIVVSS